jgi:hypothetical protein
MGSNTGGSEDKKAISQVFAFCLSKALLNFGLFSAESENLFHLSVFL